MASSFGDRSRGARIPVEALERFPHACAFFNGVDVLRTHPMVVIGGAIYENPFYMDPERFLEELAGREDPAAGGRSA